MIQVSRTGTGSQTTTGAGLTSPENPRQRAGGWLRLLHWVAARRPCRFIDVDGRPYLERYFLTRLPGGGCAYLHRFRAPDPDRGLHDHPWPWALSLILAGGYAELRGDPWQVRGTREVRPGRLNLIRGTTWHRIWQLRGVETWSLFCHGPKTKRWGFAVPVVPQGAQRDNGEGAPDRSRGMATQQGMWAVDAEMWRLVYDDQPEHAWGWWKTAPKGRDAVWRKAA